EVNAAAISRSTTSSVTWTAAPSTMTSTPRSQLLEPVVSTTCGLPRKLANFCSSAPVLNQMAPSTQTATTGVTCGRPSARTVETQNSSAAWRIRQVSAHSTATAAGSLYTLSKVVTGVFIGPPIVTALRLRHLPERRPPAGCQIHRPDVRTQIPAGPPGRWSGYGLGHVEDAEDV